jgi:hypothetical protein
MTRTSAAYLEIDLCEDDDTTVDKLRDRDAWLEERTVRFDFDQRELSAEAKLVVGYLTMEEHGMFADLSIEEQQQIAITLRR